jgi:hypothetical protein
MIETATAINTLRTSTEADFVPPSEQLITLTYGQLKDLITQAIEKAIQPLQDRISTLETLEEIYHGPAPQPEDIPLVSECWDKRRRVMEDLPSRVWGIEKDLSKLEETRPTPAKKPTKKTQDHITQIACLLANKEKRLVEGSAPRSYVDRLRKEGMTFSQLANIMGLTTDRIRQLSQLAAGDQRFNITWHPRKKNTKIFKLRRWDAPGL